MRFLRPVYFLLYFLLKRNDSAFVFIHCENEMQLQPNPAFWAVLSELKGCLEPFVLGEFRPETTGKPSVFFPIFGWFWSKTFADYMHFLRLLCPNISLWTVLSGLKGRLKPFIFSKSLSKTKGWPSCFFPNIWLALMVCLVILCVFYGYYSIVIIWPNTMG